MRFSNHIQRISNENTNSMDFRLTLVKSGQALCKHDASHSYWVLFESEGSEMLVLSFTALTFVSLPGYVQDNVAENAQFLLSEQKQRHLEMNYKLQHAEGNFA